MSITLAFDVYGTLIDTQGVVVELEEMIGQTAAGFSRTWREKQLEYSFRRGLMQNYRTFAVCTAEALDYTCLRFRLDLTTTQRKRLLAAYRSLPAFGDVAPGLQQTQDAGFRVFAFSNGSRDAVAGLLGAAGIRDRFEDVVSVDDLRSFKPNPAVYSHFLRCAGVSGDQAWMISSNPFDVIGAVSAGMRAIWVRRSPDMVFDPWGIEPTRTVSSLKDLVGAVAQQDSTSGTS